jgi:hypothetical protein
MSSSLRDIVGNRGFDSLICALNCATAFCENLTVGNSARSVRVFDALTWWKHDVIMRTRNALSLAQHQSVPITHDSPGQRFRRWNVNR